MEKKYQLNTSIGESLINYIRSLSTDLYEINFKHTVQKAYDYCELELTKEEREEKLAEVAKKYYKLLIIRQSNKLVQLTTKEPMKKYHANNLITLYVLIFLQDHEDILGITEENRFSV